MPKIIYRHKEAPEGKETTRYISPDQLRVLQLFNSSQDTVPPCKASNLAEMASTSDVVLVSNISEILDSLLKMHLVVRYDAVRLCDRKYAPTYDYLRVLS